MDNNHNNFPTKKRKANDGSAKAADGAHDMTTNNSSNDGGGFLSSWLGYYFSGRRDGTSSAPSCGDQMNQSLLSQMDRMEKIMMRMEEKLAHMSSLESRCEQLEAKCSSLENKLEANSQSIKNHLETKIDLSHDKLEKKLLHYHEYNKMLVKNQSWEYSAPVRTLDDHWLSAGYNYEEAEYISKNSESLKDKTMEMRTGEFPDHGKGIVVKFSEDDPIFSNEVNEEIFPHWKEFAGALKQFTPALNLLPDDCDSYLKFYSVQMNNDTMNLVKDALMGKPFRELCFMQNNDNGSGGRRGMSADAIIDVTKSNKHLRELSICNYQMGRNDVENLCSAVRDHPSLTHLYLEDCFQNQNGVGDVMLRSLIATASNLKELSMLNNGISSSVGAMLSEFLATNPKLTSLDLERNNLNDSAIVLIANALRTNSTLRMLDLCSNRISRIGNDALRNVLRDDRSLNACADSNHICRVRAFFPITSVNSFEDGQTNRGSKIYDLLSSRNRTMSNVKHFDDIDVKLLPNMLEAAQKYANMVDSDGLMRSMQSIVNDLSIVYEVMRKWEKAFPFYKSSGAGNIDT